MRRRDLRALVPLALALNCLGCGNTADGFGPAHSVQVVFTVAASSTGTAVTATFAGLSTGQPYAPNPPWSVTVNGTEMDESNGDASTLSVNLGASGWTTSFNFAVPAVKDAQPTLGSIGHCTGLSPTEGTIVNAAAGFSTGCANVPATQGYGGYEGTAQPTSSKVTITGSCIDPVEFDGTDSGTVAPGTLHVIQAGGCPLTVTISRQLVMPAVNDVVFGHSSYTMTDVLVGTLNLSP